MTLKKLCERRLKWKYDEKFVYMYIIPQNHVFTKDDRILLICQCEKVMYNILS